MIEEKGYGKINLALQIIKRRDDGYHDIDTVFQSIGLCDTIHLREADELDITCSNPELSCDKTNLAYKAYEALLPYRKGSAGVAIHIDKHIPIAAGLAGGSTDCAAVLRGLNRLWELNLSRKALCHIGAALGADVPFCLCGGTMRGGGIGDLLCALPNLPSWQVVIMHPRTAVCTPKAYRLFDKGHSLQYIDVDAVEEAVRNSNFYKLIQAMGNTFESLVMPYVPLVQKCAAIFHEYGLRPLMTGSGPTVFALVPPDQVAADIFAALQSQAIGMDIYMSSLVRGDYD